MAAFAMIPWLRIGVVGLALASPIDALHAEPDLLKPQVLVGFEIEAPKFLRLPEQAAARNDLATSIAGEFGRRFKFADWVTRPDAAVGPPVGALTARLVETAAFPGPQISVKWFARFGSDAPIELTLPPIEIYSPTNPDWDSHNRAAFVTRVWAMIAPTLRADGFQQQVLREVVQQLSIASSVEPRSEDRVIVIPRMWKHLQLGQESKLRLVFSKGSGNAEEQGILQLVLPSQRARDPGVGRLQAAINEASFGTQPLPLTHGWHDRLPELLAGAKIACFIREYRPADHPGTLGAVTLVAD